MKEIYKELSKLFPSELAVGDIFKSGKAEYELIKITKKGESLFYHKNAGYVGEIDLDTLELKIKNISLSMVLDMQFIVNKKKFTDLDHDEYNYDDWVSDCYIEEIQDIIKLWQLRKDGKDCSLYDQSPETWKFLLEVLC